MVDQSGDVSYYLNDHLGSARAIVDSTGALRDEYREYRAFGATVEDRGLALLSTRELAVNYDLPGNTQYYVRRIGRTANAERDFRARQASPARVATRNSVGLSDCPLSFR